MENREEKHRTAKRLAVDGLQLTVQDKKEGKRFNTEGTEIRAQRTQRGERKAESRKGTREGPRNRRK
jgi:hypothetical protein